MNIKIIAEKTGLSVATISRVMNHPEKVNPMTREKVLSIMREYDYSPNQLARGLILGKTHTIALLVPNIENSLFQMISSGVETVSLSKDYTVFLCNTRENPNIEENYLQMALDRGVDGIIAVESSLKQDETKFLKNNSTAFVHIGKRRLFGCNNNCYIDHSEDAKKLTEHLLSMQYNSIGLMLDNSSLETSNQIKTGFLDAINKPKSTNIINSVNNIEGGFLTVKKLISENKLPRALITATDLQAFGVMKAAQESKIDIPNELAISSLTDSPVCAILSPPLTCIDVPAKRLGMTAARMLFDIIFDEEYASDAYKEVVLQSTLKIRKSCGNTKNIYELF